MKKCLKYGIFTSLIVLKEIRITAKTDEMEKPHGELDLRCGFFISDGFPPQPSVEKRINTAFFASQPTVPVIFLHLGILLIPVPHLVQAFCELSRIICDGCTGRELPDKT